MLHCCYYLRGGSVKKGREGEGEGDVGNGYVTYGGNGCVTYGGNRGVTYSGNGYVTYGGHIPVT